MGCYTSTMPRSKPQIIASETGDTVPESLVSAVVGSWGEITEIRIKRRGLRRWKRAADPVACITAEDEDAIEVENGDTAPEDAAAEAYDRARAVAEAEGPDTFLFTGWHATGQRTGEEVWSCPVAIDVDEEGELEAVDPAGPEQTHQALSKTIRELSGELGKVHRLQSEFMRRSFEQVDTLRTALEQHTNDRLLIAREQARQEAGIWEIQERTARAQAAGDALKELMGPLGEQVSGELVGALAAFLRSRAGTAEPAPKAPAEAPEGPAPYRPKCEPAGALDRVFSRVGEKVRGEFLGQFSPKQKRQWDAARSATSEQDFDAALVSILSEAGALTFEAAQIQISTWGRALPIPELLTLGPVFEAAGKRIGWPISRG